MFYAHLAESKSKTRALAEAQRQFRREALVTGSHHHPFYWAGFCLMGNPD
jgi:CHAT domain-containing protein